jgi:LacI family transcriptional regulator
MSINITDIARMANVSKATVSRVINNKNEGVSAETRDHILKIIQDVGYKPNLMARSIVTSRTKTIGLIIPDIENPFFPQMVRGVEDYAVSQGYTVFLCNSDMDLEKQQKYFDTFVEKRVDGLILTTSGNFKNSGNMIKRYHIPIVLVDRKISGFNYNAGVFINNTDGAYRAVKYLLQENPTKQVAFLGGPKDVDTCAERLKGYKKAYAELSIPINLDLIRFGNFTVESGFELASELLESYGPISSIFAASDIIAIGAVRALRKKGISIPDQTEIMGFDNIQISNMVFPSITTMAQPIYKIGYTAAQNLINVINGKEPAEKDQVLLTKLIVRETTRARQSDKRGD